MSVQDWPKTCACGASHTREQWSVLPDRKLWTLEGETIELRQCHCGSHIAIHVEDSDDEKDAA